MALRSTFSLSSLTSQNISFYQIATFGLFSKTTSDITSSLTRNLFPHEKTRRVISHIIGGALAYGISLNLPTRSWIPQPLSIPVALTMALSLYLYSSNPFSNKPKQAKPANPDPQIKKLEEQIGKLQGELSAAKEASSEHDKGISQAKEKELQPRIDTLQKQLAAAEEEKQKLQKEAEDHLAKLQARDSRIGKLQGELSAAKKTGADQEKEKLQPTIDTLQKQLATAEKEREKLQKEVEGHLAQLQARDAQIGALKVLDADNKAGANQAKEKELQRDIDRLMQSLRDAQEETQAFRDGETRLISQLSSQATQLKQLGQHLTELEKQKKSLEAKESAQGTNQNDELDSTKRQLQASKTAYADLIDRYNNLQNELKELEGKNSQKGLPKLSPAHKEASQHRKQQESTVAPLAHPKLTPSSALPQRIDRSSDARTLRTPTEPPTHRRTPSGFIKPNPPDVSEAITSGSRRAQSAERPPRSTVVEMSQADHAEGPPRNALEWIKQLCRAEGVKAPESFTSPEWTTGLPLAVVVKAFTQEKKINIQGLKPENLGFNTIKYALDMVKEKGFSENLSASDVGTNAQEMAKYFEKMYSQFKGQRQPLEDPSQTSNALLNRLDEMVKGSSTRLKNVPPDPGAMKGIPLMSLWIRVLSAFNGVEAPPSLANFKPAEWTGFELCRIMALFRPDLINLGNLNPNDRATNIRLGMAAFEKASNEPSSLETDIYGEEQASMYTFYQQIHHIFDPKMAIMQAILDRKGKPSST